MPALPVVPATLKVTSVFTWGEDVDVISRMFITYAGSAPDAAELDTFCGAVATSWAGDVIGEFGTFVTLARVEAIDLSSDTSPSGEAVVGTAGTRVGTELDAAAAMVAGYEITRRYRGGHPRGYWPAGVEADLQDAQTWTSAFTTEFQGAFGTWISDITSSPWAGASGLTHTGVSYKKGFTVVISPTTGRARNIPTDRGAAVIDPIVAVIARTRVGSQRRRLGRS